MHILRAMKAGVLAGLDATRNLGKGMMNVTGRVGKGMIDVTGRMGKGMLDVTKKAGKSVVDATRKAGHEMLNAAHHLPGFHHDHNEQEEHPSALEEHDPRQHV